MTLTEKSLHKILKEQREEYQRYLGVVVEDFTSQVKLIAETLTGTQKQLIELRDMVAKNTEDIEELKMMVLKNTEDIDVMKMDLHVIKDDLKEKIDRKEFKTLEHRVALVERKVSRPFRIARG